MNMNIKMTFRIIMNVKEELEYIIIENIVLIIVGGYWILELFINIILNIMKSLTSLYMYDIP